MGIECLDIDVFYAVGVPEKARGLDNIGEKTKTGDAGLKHLVGLPRFARLYLSDTRVTDAGLDHVGKMLLLQDLDLSRTRITDAGIMKLTRLKKISRLGVTNKSVTKEGVARFRQVSGNKHEVRH